MKFVKYIKRQDSGWKQQPGHSGETSINLSNEICEYLAFGLLSKGEEQYLTFLIYKEDFVSAINFIITQCPLYRTSSRSYERISADSLLIEKINNNLEKYFGDQEVMEYTVILYHRNDGRIYLKGLKHLGFTIRDFLVENSSALVFKDEDGVFSLRVLSAVFEQ